MYWILFLHLPCTELELCILQFEKHVRMQYLGLIKTTNREGDRKERERERENYHGNSKQQQILF